MARHISQPFLTPAHAKLVMRAVLVSKPSVHNCQVELLVTLQHILILITVNEVLWLFIKSSRYFSTSFFSSRAYGHPIQGTPCISLMLAEVVGARNIVRSSFSLWDLSMTHHIFRSRPNRSIAIELSCYIPLFSEHGFLGVCSLLTRPQIS